jgi:antitoxin component YwqK of YwqJK toxin-antitoxin module
MNDLINSMAQTIFELEEENAKLKERLEQYETVSKNVEPTTTNELTPYIEYHPNGNVRVKGQKNSKGQRESIWEYFWENGNIEFITPYKEGKKDGIEEWFYENGNIESRTSYKDGKEDGIEEYFDEQGNITETYLWKNGKLIEETEN